MGTGAVGDAPAWQARGSHGSRLDVVGDGASIFDAVGEVVVVVATGAVVAVVAGAVLTVAPALDGVGDAGGELTANWLPVTTVTSAPSATMLGS